MSESGKNIINDTILSSAQSGDNKQTEALIRQYRNVVEAIAGKYINSPLEYSCYRVTSMSDVCEWSAMYDCRNVFQSLYKVWFQSIF